jgi:hypothetical protein
VSHLASERRNKNKNDDDTARGYVQQLVGGRWAVRPREIFLGTDEGLTPGSNWTKDSLEVKIVKRSPSAQLVRDRRLVVKRWKKKEVGQRRERGDGNAFSKSRYISAWINFTSHFRHQIREAVGTRFDVEFNFLPRGASLKSK